MRRLRYGALVKLFRHRWGYVLPDDDAGRGDLWELVTNVSLAVNSPDKKVKHVIALWAPWMPPDKVEMMDEHVKVLTIYERTPTAISRRKRFPAKGNWNSIRSCAIYEGGGMYGGCGPVTVARYASNGTSLANMNVR